MTFKSFLAISALTLSALTWNSIIQAAVPEISTAAQLTQITSSNQNVIAKFSAPWCGPCKAMAPIFNALSNEAAWQGVKFVAIDIDKSRSLASTYNVQSIPTTILFKNGKEVGRINGGSSKQELINKMKFYFQI